MDTVILCTKCRRRSFTEHALDHCLICGGSLTDTFCPSNEWDTLANMNPTVDYVNYWIDYFYPNDGYDDEGYNILGFNREGYKRNSFDKQCNCYQTSDFSNSAFSFRLEKLKILQALRKDKDEGYRELCCFIFYNTAKQLYGSGRATLELKEYNEGFTVPLSVQELSSAIASTERRNFYCLSDKWIIEKLNITEEENLQCGFGVSRLQIKRVRAKQESEKKRDTRDAKITSYVIEHPEKNYNEVAEHFKLSRATITNILKKSNIIRYKNDSSKAEINNKG